MKIMATTIEQHKGTHSTGLRHVELHTVRTECDCEIGEGNVCHSHYDLHQAEIALASLDCDARKRAHELIDEENISDTYDATAVIRRAIAEAAGVQDSGRLVDYQTAEVLRTASEAFSGEGKMRAALACMAPGCEYGMLRLHPGVPCSACDGTGIATCQNCGVQLGAEGDCCSDACVEAGIVELDNTLDDAKGM